MFRLDGVLVKTRTKLFSGDKFSAAAKDLNETNRLTQRISAGDHPYKTRGPTGQQQIYFYHLVFKSLDVCKSNDYMGLGAF